MTSFCDFGNIISLVSTNYTLELRKCFPLCYTKTKKHYNKGCDIHAKGRFRELKLLLAGISARLTKNRDFFVQADCTLVSGKKKFDAKLSRADEDYTLHFQGSDRRVDAAEFCAFFCRAG